MSKFERADSLFVIDRKEVDPLYPTNFHSPIFWEELGRLIATFGFLEKTLMKAIFVFQGTKEQYDDPEKPNSDFEVWFKQLEVTAADTLHPLAEKYRDAVKENPNSTRKVEDLVNDIKSLAKVRNVLCHGFWEVPDETGKSLPKFIGKKNFERCEEKFDHEDLQKLRERVVGLAFMVIDTVTTMGWQFPGSLGPGKPTTIVA